MSLRTERLELRPVGLAGARAQVRDPAGFFRMLDVPAPAQWPPPPNDDDSMRYWLGLLEADPAAAIWAEYALVALAPRRLVGNGGFKGAPKNGAVEIGYSILPAEQGRGYATEAAMALVAFARTHGVRRVLADTLEDGTPSQNVLRKCGFARTGERPEPGVVRWSLEV